MLSWKRRTRIDGGLRDHVDVPLKEESEHYEVAIYDGAVKKRSWRVTGPQVTYTAAEQVSDFTSLPGTVRMTVAQLSALAGLGSIADATVAVSAEEV